MPNVPTESASPPAKRAPGRPPSDVTDAEATRHLILQTALTLFQTHDYSDVSMAHIAETAGVTKATLYYHFKSKAEIVTTGIVASLEAIVDLVHRIFDQPERSVRDKLMQLMDERRDQIALISASERMIQDMRVHLDESQQRAIDQAHRRIVDQFTALMHAGISQGEVKSLDPEWLGLMFQHLMGLVPPSASDQQHELDNLILTVFFDGAGK